MRNNIAMVIIQVNCLVPPSIYTYSHNNTWGIATAPNQTYIAMEIGTSDASSNIWNFYMNEKQIWLICLLILINMQKLFTKLLVMIIMNYKIMGKNINWIPMDLIQMLVLCSHRSASDENINVSMFGKDRNWVKWPKIYWIIEIFYNFFCSFK